MNFRQFLWAVIPFLVLCCKTEPKRETSSTERHQGKIEKLDSLIRSLVDDGHTAGIAYGIRFGKDTTHLAAYGLADLDTGRKVDTTTQFGLASLTKPFTALAIAKLAEEGKLKFDDSISRFFPGFPIGDEVTVYQLLAHTSGINEWWNGGLPEGVPQGWTTGPNPHIYLGQMKNVYLFEPGTQYSYSNMGYLLLGEIIEKVSGLSYEEYLQKHIFKSAGMENTSLIGKEESFEYLAKGYTFSEQTDSVATAHFVPAMFIAGSLKSFGGLKSNVDDMMKWSDVLFNGKLIKEALLAQITTYAKVQDGRPVFEVKYVDPQYPQAPPSDYMKKDGYGLGFNLTEIFGKKAIWHSGGMPGYNSLSLYFPDSNTSLIILSNTDNGIVPVFEKLMKVVTKS